MAKYKITPVNVKTGAVAPFFVEHFEDNQTEAKLEAFANSLSPLFKFSNWMPSISGLSSKLDRKRG